MRALPWVLLGKRVQVQPDLDVSSAELVYGKTLDLPGHFLQPPDAPLTNLQTRALVEELYKMSAKPALQTSATVNPIDISKTEKATHVFVKRENHLGLTPLFDGPLKIISRPSRSQVEVRMGSYVNGQPPLQTIHWSSCKIAPMPADAEEVERPNLGRKPKPPSESSAGGPNPLSESASGDPNAGTDQDTPTVEVTSEPEETQTESRPKEYTTRSSRSTRNANPIYV